MFSYEHATRSPASDMFRELTSHCIKSSDAPRLDYRRSPLFKAFLPAMEAAHRTIVQSSPEERTQELVRIGVSQINGCSCCVGSHTQDLQRRARIHSDSTFCPRDGRGGVHRRRTGRPRTGR
ncbi:carboxymuconolactone decarboxylase family protein [Nocardia beijingensis]|uniref:carboxymuconolactone decarboxylase family protein n=1 Tax=Nocardia beijingensis TaxID=95162 RepID=UPI0034005A6B